MADKNRLDGSQVFHRNQTKTYVLLAFEMRSGAEILSQALFAEPGSGNADMVDDAAETIKGRLVDLCRSKGTSAGAPKPRSDETEHDGEQPEPGSRTFATSQRYLVPMYVILILGLFMLVSLMFSTGPSFFTLFFGGVTVAVVYLLLKLPGSLKLVVDDGSIEMIGFGGKREVQVSDLRLVRQVSDIQGFYEVSTLELIYNDGRVEPCGTLKGSMWPEKPGWAMVHEAAALINARIGHV